MTRLAPALAPVLALASLLCGCASQRVSLEGLRPRAAEAIDPRVPLPSEPVAGQVDTSLAGQARAAEQRASEGAAAFDRLLPKARTAAAGAGPRESESWIGAQLLLSALVDARAPVSLALADLDAMSGTRLQSVGDVGVADRAVLEAASARVAAIDAAEHQAISEIRARLAR